MAFSYDLLAEYGYLPPGQAFPRMKDLARRALEIDATTAEAYTALALAAGYYDRDWIRADEAYRRALELNANSVITHDWYGVVFLGPMGRHDEAVAHSKRAKELDPLTAYIRVDLGWTYNHARRWDDAITECKQIPDIDPEFYFTYWCLGFAYWQKGMLEEAVAAYERAVELEPHDLGLQGDLAIVYAAAGKQDQAQKILEEVEQTAQREYVPAYAWAMANMAIGNLDGTYAWLDKMYEERSPVLIFMNEHARYDRLRDDLRFQQLLRKIGFKELKFIPKPVSD
jgi:tetratricopeptide (TPR) repeat protein